MDDKNKVDITRTEQWEYTATGFGMSATGTSELSAERNLLRRVIEELTNSKTMESNMENEVKSKTKNFEIEDCPFCGSPDDLGKPELVTNESNRHQVICTNAWCGASGGFDEDKEEAIKVWNQRQHK